jgi:hypothetical protein
MFRTRPRYGNTRGGEPVVIAHTHDCWSRPGEALVAAEPDAFPWSFSGMTVRFGRTMWNVDPLGYQPDHPLYEVLCDVGAICDPEGWWSYTSQDPGVDFYVVTFVSQELSSSTERPPSLSFVWTEVPPEFHGGPPLEVRSCTPRASPHIPLG